MPAVFGTGAAYLPSIDDPQPNWGYLGPEMSRRSRAIDIWTTLRAYGRSGYRVIVEHHLDLARQLASAVDEAPDLERLADVPLNIVCFRARPPEFPESALDELNRRVGAAVLEDGRVFFGSTIYDGKVAFRPAPVNWRNRPQDIDEIVEVTRELAGKIAPELA
jgi:glutamate/tyrosine decarboxylase-like PLP-dependent enzyme